MRPFAIFGCLIVALLAFACGGGSSSKEGANPTLQALIDQAEQTPVADYEREYARQLCGPIGTFFETAGETFTELENQPTPESLDDFNFDALTEAFGTLIDPFEKLLEDTKDIDPPRELKDYHESVVAELEYALEAIKAIKTLGIFGALSIGEAPPPSEELPGLQAGLVIECGPELEQFFGEFGGGLFGDSSSDDGFSFDETPSPPETGDLGDAIENGDYELTVHSVTDPVVPSDEFFGPDDGNRWVMIEVSITNVSNEPQDYGSYDFKLKDADNFEYTTGFVDLQRELNSGTLTAGDTVRGQIGFEVPENARVVRLIYDPGFFGNSRIDVTLR